MAEPTARQLEVFAATRRHGGNQSAAAVELRLTRQYVGQSVRAVEKLTGERLGRGKRASTKPAPRRADPPVRAVVIAPSPARGHVIADVGFRGHVGPSGTAPLRCACSWAGTVDGFQPHRAAERRRRVA